MNNGWMKKILPHVIAVAVFVIVSAIFCKPALEGNTLSQHDISGWKGMAQNAFEYKEKHGHFPLWNTNLFSGMPNYQVAMEGKSVFPDLLTIMSLGLPKPMNFFFMACICFYILGLALGLKPVINILGSLAFAFSTYNPIIIGVGHESKMWAIAFMPLMLSGILLVYNKKYWAGLALTAFGTMLEIAVNHPQINYYLLLAIVAITIPYVIYWIKEKDFKHILMAGAIVLAGSIAGVANSAVTLMTTYEYTKATMRGGKDVEIDNKGNVSKTKTTGLDTSYAFQYSLGKAETFVVMMPDAFGSSSSKTLGDESKVVEKLTEKGVPENNALQLANQLPRYWGGIDGVGTAGPPYVGIIICLLALIGFVVLKHPLRWGLLAATVVGIILAWGKYLPGINTLLFTHLPMYNKFRAPSMAMVITELTLPITAALSLQYILYRDKAQELLKHDFKNILFAVGGLFVLLLILYATMNYTGPFDNEISGNLTQSSQNPEIARAVISGMKADRKAMFGGQILRSFGFAIIVLGLLYSYLKNILKPIVVAIIFAAVTFIDLFVVDKDYLNDENYVPKEELNVQFTPTSADTEILKDTSVYRVFNAGGDRYSESRTSYFHKSVGGYHPAKLRIYQDVIDQYLSGQPNQQILDMLNTKYIYMNNGNNAQPSLMKNDSAAFGPVWLVKNVKLVNDNVAELKDLGTTNLRDTALVQKDFSKDVVQPQWDSAASIKLSHFDNDKMEYSFNSSSPQFAVFSEIYYPYGWNAYIDGKKVNYVRSNYILRGLSIPAGQHKIEFIFEPDSYKTGKNISFIGSIIVLIMFLGGLFMQWKTSNKEEAAK